MQLLTLLDLLDYRKFWNIDGSVKINNIALNNNCVNRRNFFQNCVSAFQKMVIKNRILVKKICVVWTMRYRLNFTSMWCEHFVKNVFRDFRLPMSALATVAGKNCNGNFAAKIDLSIGLFMLPLLMLILKV